ncbi:MAG: ATP-dependent Clp protease ATP-binding subunit [Patescibacteria group bacterium]|jgi:ATP-dependent Clp protease ATP-binding subunit ClpC
MQEDQFSKFSPSTRDVLIKAQEIAMANNVPLATYHIILALLILPDSLAHGVLINNGLTLTKADEYLNAHKNDLAEQSDPKSMVTKDLINVLEKAMQLTATLGHVGLDTEHLLLATLSFKENSAYKLVSECAGNPDNITTNINNLFEELDRVNRINFDMDNDFEFNQNQPDDPVSAKTRKSANSPAALYATDLTDQARKGELDPVIGREIEIDRVIKILSRRTKNNPVLIGEPGVGKTAIVEGLAQRIANGDVPSALNGFRVLNLDLSLMVAGTMYRGQFEERIKKFINSITKLNDCIIFIDELHTIIGAGSAEGSLDASQILKPALAKGQIRLIGATTLDEFQKHIEKDAALTRRFQTIIVAEPTPKDTIKILHGLKANYEKHHQVTITDEAIEAAVNLSTRYITGRFLPDKAIDLLDESAADVRMHQRQKTSVINLIKQKDQLSEEKDRAVFEERYDVADQLQKQIVKIDNQIKNYNRVSSARQPLVSVSDIEKTVAQITDTPTSTLAKTELNQIKNIETIIAKEIIGQTEAISAVSNAIKRSRTGISQTNRPVGSFIFLGPSGVGKTELARVIARRVYGKDDALVKIDMSEFMEKHNVSRLIGAPAGYIGYEEGGKLTEIIRRHPYSVVLLDEIEKAHPDTFNILLQILEDGFITDTKGRKIDFRHAIIIMTSNIGLDELTHHAEIGFNSANSSQSYDQLKDKLLKELKVLMKPELLNRIDQAIVFKPLTPENIRQIVDIQVNQLLTRLNEKGIKLQIDLTARKYLAEKGFEPKNGARPIRRAIQTLIEDKIADGVLMGKINPNKTVLIRRTSDELEMVI